MNTGNRDFFYAVRPFVHTETRHQVAETKQFWKNGQGEDFQKPRLQCCRVDVFATACVVSNFIRLWLANLALRLGSHRRQVFWRALDGAYLHFHVDGDFFKCRRKHSCYKNSPLVRSRFQSITQVDAKGQTHCLGGFTGVLQGLNNKSWANRWCKNINTR